jgi:hypothetical protein
VPDDDSVRVPRQLALGLLIVAIQASCLVGYGLAELLAIQPGRVVMGFSTGLFLVGYGMAAGWAGWSLRGLRIHARGFVMMTQAIWLGVAWSFRGGGTSWIAVLIAAAAITVVIAILHPSSTEALVSADRESGPPSPRR